MAEPTLIDARQGLSSQGIETLSRASRVQIGIKNAVTIMLGCWVEAEPAGGTTEAPVAILIKNGLYSPIPARPKMLFSVSGPGCAEQWRELLDRVHPGDVLSLGRASMESGELTIQFLIHAPNGDRSKTIFTVPAA